jgi:hypothetical protein
MMQHQQRKAATRVTHRNHLLQEKPIQNRDFAPNSIECADRLAHFEFESVTVEDSIIIILKRTRLIMQNVSKRDPI